jgi:hypothetical protein
MGICSGLCIILIHTVIYYRKIHDGHVRGRYPFTKESPINADRARRV